MKPQEREILHNLLMDLFLDSPHTKEANSSQQKGVKPHEKIFPHARPARGAQQTDIAHD